jgi:predicted enzyme involved in methoxymalonyl-ACP biosynthesis
MENFALNTVVDYAKDHGYKKIIGEYISTSKNNMVSEFYPELGFSRLDVSDRCLFSLEVDSYEKRECYITESK